MNNEGTAKRVTCRGCTADCLYYSECGGRLWRLTESQQNKCLEKRVNKPLDKSLKQ